MNKTKGKKRAQAIGQRNRLALAYLELAADNTFQKLPQDYKLVLINEVLAIGDQVAREIKSEYNTTDPRRIAAQLGLRVFGEDRGCKKGVEYRRGKKEIVVYRDFHQRLLREVKSPELSEHLLKFIIAYKLFSHLELNGVGEVYKKYKFRKWQLGPFCADGYIKGLSNVAAQAFTQTLLNLEISPPVFDYLTYILYTNR